MSGLFLVLVSLIISKLALADPIVQLPNGKVLGRQTANLQNKTFYAFEGIPYAKPPTGSLRFKAPQAPDDWEGVLNTTYLDSICIQSSFQIENESEDCLYLSVYTPELPDENNNVSLPVMVFFYGGGFIDGFSQLYQPDLLMNHGVILVTLNYRVGIFGFLSTQDEVIPGNNGLKDQQLAMKWTSNNIHLFGGNSSKVTIFGQSAGAISVGHHLLNQDNAGLFQGAILQSASSLTPSGFQRNARKIAFSTASILNSSFKTNNDSQALLDFLQSVSVEDIKTAVFEYRRLINYSAKTLEYNRGFTYAPVIETKNPDAYITKKMYGLAQAGSMIKVPVMIGITSEEFLVMLDPATVESLMKEFDENLGWLVPDDMQILNSKDLEEMGTSIRKLYTGGKPFSENLSSAIRYFSDNVLTRSIIKYGKISSQFTPTYFYQFSYNGELGHVTSPYDDIDGVGHTEDLSYLMCSQYGCDDSSYPEEDRLTSQRMLKLWTDFAKYQNPTPEKSELLQNVTWPVVDLGTESFQYLDIDKELTIKSNPKEETFSTWEYLYDSLNFTDFDTY